MSQIVPRLYRYQFDPNPRIQQAMTGIWNALVKDNKKTVCKLIVLQGILSCPPTFIYETFRITGANWL